MTDTMKLEYTGQRTDAFGVKGLITHARYKFVQGKVLVVDRRDGVMLLEREPDLWREVRPEVRPTKVNEATTNAPKEEKL